MTHHAKVTLCAKFSSCKFVLVPKYPFAQEEALSKSVFVCILDLFCKSGFVYIRPFPINNSQYDLFS